MKKVKPLGEGSLAHRVLRALGMGSGFELPSDSHEEKHPGVAAYHPHYDFHKEFKSALLEAKRLKAKGIVEYQKRNLPR